MPQFFIRTADICKDNIIICEKNTFHHLVKVLRVKKGEKLSLVDENQAIYETEVIEIAPNKVISKILNKKKSDHYLNTKLYLAQAVLKNDAQAIMIQKATELGVKGIIPLSTDNTVIKDSIIDTKIEKWNKISLEAVKQCERTDIPMIYPKLSLEELLKSDEFPIKIACVERDQKMSMKNILKNLNYNCEDKIVVITGPEGGFSKSETELFDKYNIKKVSLGKMILRAETAAISALSNIIYELENDKIV